MAKARTKQGFTLPSWMHKLARHRGLIVPVGFVMLLVVILVPLPAAALDILISANISLAVIILLTTLYMNRALDFSVFPSLLLATTLLRLVLNIASTRLILTADAQTPEAAIGVAGEVISGAGAVAADVAGKAAAAPKSAWSMAREVFAKKSDPAEPKP